MAGASTPATGPICSIELQTSKGLPAHVSAGSLPVGKRFAHMENIKYCYPASPIVPWIGGKRRLAERIFTFFPSHKCYVEPFAGGAAMFFHRPIPADAEVLNDINGDLINLYRVVQNHLEEFVRQFKWALSSRKVFEWEQMKNPETLTDIQRAARFYYLQHLAFGGLVSGQNFGTATTGPPGLNLLRLEESLSAAHLRLANVCIEHLAWQDCIKRYDRPHTLFYMDPPYWQTEGYGVPFEFDQYVQMAALMRSIEGKAIISLNDHPDIRQVFAGLHFEQTDIKYTVAGGKGTAAGEVLIFNWDIDANPSSLF
jgi:DNA adenine methylase